MAISSTMDKDLLYLSPVRLHEPKVSASGKTFVHGYISEKVKRDGVILTIRTTVTSENVQEL